MIIGSRYELYDESPLRGGMSEVRVGTDIHLDRQVILKCLQPLQDAQRIIDEQMALQRVFSKHVVQLLDIVQLPFGREKQTYLVIEFVEGNDLEENSMEYDDQYLLILWQIATGLSEIHQFSIIHRDIKPGNIRIDQEGVAKIFDFGLAREQGINNQTREAIGTPLYIAPEMLVDATINFSTSADVFSFAVTALTLLRRPLPPWIGHQYGPVPADAITRHIPEFPDSLADVMQRCLAKLPSDRPSMDEVRAELSKIILYDRHSAQLVLGGQVSLINRERRQGFPKVVKQIDREIVSGLRIEYDGNDFVVLENIGNVVANNLPIFSGAKLAPSCVIAFPRAESSQPYFATFNVNQPEVLV